MNNSGITIKEIAETLGYSTSTISKALNNAQDVSPVTKKKIIETANLYHYKPNFFAKGLRNKKSFILGVILSDLKDTFFLELLNGITVESTKNNYKIMVYLTCNDFIKEVTYANLLSDGNIIDGLILSPSKETLISKKDDHLKIQIKRGLPIVFIKKYDSHNFSSNIFNKKSDSNTLNKNGYEVGRNSVKKLLGKIKVKSL